MRKLCLLCTLLLGTGLVLAQSDTEAASGTPITTAAQSGGIQGVGGGDALAVPAFGQPGGYRDADDCPNDPIVWQDYSACGGSQYWYFYTDLMFCLTPPTTCRRVRCENFPPPNMTIPSGTKIGVVSWTGVYVDDASNGCTKTDPGEGGHQFRISFYQDSGGQPADPNNPYYSEHLVAIAEDTGRTVLFSGASVPATIWRFRAVLTNPVNLTTGWFSICGDGTPLCYHLWEGSAEGNNSFYQWFETDFANTYLHVTDKCDQAYCFSVKQIGACCNDCGGECIDLSNDLYCKSVNGRFWAAHACADFGTDPNHPECGEGTGACCHDNGSATEGMQCCPCEPTHPGCEHPPDCCIGDMNCDGFINFADINPFVAYLSGYAGWQAEFPECSPCNGDINCDGTYPDFGDINPFVALMVDCGGVEPNGCPCPGPNICPPPWVCDPGEGHPSCKMHRERTQGDYWAGPNTTVANCCTVTNPGFPLEDEEPNNPAADCATDVYNGGCNMTTPKFSTITCGGTIYAESANFGQGQRDTDWYRVTITTPRYFTVTVTAEFDVRIRAYREGPNPAQPCVGYEEVATAVEPLAGTHNQCTDVVLQTRCLPAAGDPNNPAPAYYYFVVEPALSYGVRCRSDYKINVMCTACDPCQVSCPDGSYLEGEFNDPNDPDPGYCMVDPNDPTFDPENGGCNDPNLAFEPLPYDPADPNCVGLPCTFTVCGKLWARNGYRDLDWYKVDLPPSAQVAWTVLTEVPVRATLFFMDLGGGSYGPPVDCTQYYYWIETMVPACVETTWDQPTIIYEAGTYWFFLAPSEGDPASENPIWTGYPCPMGGVDLGTDYTLTMTVTPKSCPNEVLAKPVGHIEDPNNPNTNPPCPTPTDWVDTYNSGCDKTPPGPMQTILLNAGSSIDPSTAWLGQTGSWLSDPNDPNSLKKDYDWYKFTLTNSQRFRVLLYADFRAGWEIWDPNDPNSAGVGCAKGPTEGLDLGEPCHSLGVWEWTRRCYPGGAGGREYWLRVFPISRVGCGKYYYLALCESSSCNPCGWSCTSPFPNIDDVCDDLTDYDTNAGCDDPNAPPPHFMTFNFGTTYCGRIYAGLQNGAPYYDPEWFKITQTNTVAKKFKFTLRTEYLAHLEVYLSCADYDNVTPIAGLDVYSALTGGTACPEVTPQSTINYAQGTTVYGRFTCVDQLQNLLTKYYPCAKGWNRWRMIPTAVAF
jgi:hypothetical protein